jgi:hypothetical protein
MAATTTKPDFSETLTDNLSDLSGKGVKLLNSLTANRIWAENDLQYFFTNDESFDTGNNIGFYFNVAALDDTFGFSTLANRAYEMIDAVSNLDFTQVFSSAGADHILGSVTDASSGFEGFFEFPNLGGSSFGVLNQGPAQMENMRTGRCCTRSATASGSSTPIRS